MMGTAGPFTGVGSLRRWLAAPRAAREDALRSCLDRIRDLDPGIHAWVQVLPQAPTGDGPLAGIPFAAKDIIETRGLATEYGSPIYKGRIGTEDAAIVSELRRRGAILLGKTHTAAFAYRTPAPTRNPRRVAHTPGGSSSGSAAAVAAGMVPFALGTQTQGSVLRPASYCGVTGFKPTYGTFPMDGILPLAKSLDTLGFFTESAADMLALWEALGRDAGGAWDTPAGVPDTAPDAEPAMASAFEQTVARLRAAGVSVTTVDLGDMLPALNASSRTVMFYEGARVHEQRYRDHGSALGHLADLVREGLRIPAEEYENALWHIAACRARMSALYETTPVIIVPAATGPAPFGLASTGDARMNAPWTALGTPAISIPMASAGALPLGLQLTANPGEDGRVLRAAVRLEALLSA
jgi:Asp-tRNA(Asn)/Glu-tRNA(Gln) amidotransferase A subunit family amidase